MTRDEAIDRSNRAKSANADFIAPACAALKAEYLEALTRIAANEPWETAKITKLSVALRVIDAVEQHVGAAIASGTPAQADRDRAERISKLPEAKRRWI